MAGSGDIVKSSQERLGSARQGFPGDLLEGVQSQGEQEVQLLTE